MSSNIYTDLAMEARELSGKASGIAESNDTKNGVAISRIDILDEAAGERIGKRPGRYVTLEAPKLAERTDEVFRSVAFTLASELSALTGELDENATILIAGLGNRYVTPDSLGPRVAERVFVTRHINKLMPEALPGRVRSVCAVSPGVMGVTGVQTRELLSGIVDNIRPDLMIAVDSLASRRAARISSTVQLSNAGISPGGGVGNTQAGLFEEELDVPVIAIGVPMVVYASTIAEDTINYIAGDISYPVDREKLTASVARAMDEHIGPLIVTPKDIDTIVEDMSKVVAEGINRALFGRMYGEIASLTS